jgi:hypothetical protein
MKSRAATKKGLRRAPWFAAALTCVGTAHGQATSCPLTDYQCVQKEFPNVCFDDKSKLRLDTCLAWLSEIERSPSPDIRSSAAAIYGLIAPHPEAIAIRTDLHARREELILGVLEENPWHPGALLGFAGLAEGGDERVRRLRDATTADPDNPMLLESLSISVRDTDGGMLEAATIMERAYELSCAKGGCALRFARDAMWEYREAGAPERADRLRERVAADYGLAAMLEEAANAATADSASLDRTLQELCRDSTLRVFGAKPCLDSIDHTIAAADRARDAAANRLEQVASAAMFTAARSAWQLDPADPGWRRRFEAALERHSGADEVARLRRVPLVMMIE